MSRLVSALLAASLAAALAAPAAAQPGAEPPPQPGEAAPPPPAPGPQAPLVMSAEERDLLLEGEIPTERIIGGGIVALFVPFGIGQAVEGRWAERGWVFTAGEAGSIAGIVYGADQCSNSDQCGTLVVGVLGLVGFRIWEMVDAWVAPAMHNNAVREVRLKYGITPDMVPYEARRVTPYVAPGRRGGWTGGVALRF